jgi:hypothetical protein
MNGFCPMLKALFAGRPFMSPLSWYRRGKEGKQVGKKVERKRSPFLLHTMQMQQRKRFRWGKKEKR